MNRNPDAIQIVIARTPLVKITEGRGAHGVTGDAGIHASKGDWVVGINYIESDWVFHPRADHGKGMYRAKSSHLSAAINEPEDGASWATYWERGPEGGEDGTDGIDGEDGDITGPATTTENKLPQWDSTQKTLKDGLALTTSIGNPGSDSLIPTEQAVAEAIESLQTGWVPSGETWTYAGVDAPSYAFIVAGDKSAKYYPGMKVKITQTSVRYFIITKVEAATDTIITIYGGTDYVLDDATLTSPCFSMMRAPAGFPLDPEKWAVTVTSAGGQQNNPVSDTWYNIASVSISVPKGIWRAKYRAALQDYEATEAYGVAVYASLSTSANSESHPAFTTSVYAANVSSIFAILSQEQVLAATSKTTYYLIEKSYDFGSVDILFLTLVEIKLYCAYL